MFQVLSILIWGNILQTGTVLSIEDWKLISHPPHFLQPPPISRSYRHHYLGSKHQPAASPRVQNIRSAQAKWYDPRKQWPPLLDSVPKYSEYAYQELQCNPCNNVPWIPIITLNPAKILPPSHPPQSPFNSYYHTFNQMTANLVKPSNVPTLPFYLGTPVYQQHVQNPAWHSGPSVVASSNPTAPVFSLPLQETSRNVAAPAWGVKPIPVLHYSHTIEYPAHFSTGPSADLSVHPTSLPFSQIPVSFEDDGPQDILSNHVDDTKYSSSENKFSVSNETVKDVRHLKTNDTPVYNGTDLPEYLTPPETLRPTGYKHIDINPDWAVVNEIPKPEKKKKQIQIVIPYAMTKQNAKVVQNITSWNSAIKIRDVGTSSTTVLPIIRYLRDNVTTKKQEWTDWHKLRKAIDTWTVEGFSNHKYGNLTSVVDVTTPASTTWKSLKDDQESVSTDNHIGRGKPDTIQNRVSSGIKSAESASKSQLWNDQPTVVSAVTKEKVFIVTPVPLTNYNFSTNEVGKLSEYWIKSESNGNL